MVTFLPAATARTARAAHKTQTSTDGGENPSAAGGRYPRALQEEYEALIHKKLRQNMTVEEALRLEAVRAEINVRDRQSESWSAWQRHAADVDAEIADLRHELESLPDA